MASDGKQQVVIPWRQQGELILEHLRDFRSLWILLIDLGLGCFGENLSGKLPQPGFEQ